MLKVTRISCYKIPRNEFHAFMRQAEVKRLDINEQVALFGNDLRPLTIVNKQAQTLLWTARSDILKATSLMKIENKLFSEIPRFVKGLIKLSFGGKTDYLLLISPDDNILTPFITTKKNKRTIEPEVFNRLRWEYPFEEEDDGPFNMESFFSPEALAAEEGLGKGNVWTGRKPDLDSIEKVPDDNSIYANAKRLYDGNCR
jgi:hypothetical protein